MTNDVHSRIADIRRLQLTSKLRDALHPEINKQFAVLAPLIADDAEKMLALLLEARENDMQVCDYDFINTGGLPKYEDGPLGKKIAEFLEGK